MLPQYKLSKVSERAIENDDRDVFISATLLLEKLATIKKASNFCLSHWLSEALRKFCLNGRGPPRLYL